MWNDARMTEIIDDNQCNGTWHTAVSRPALGERIRANGAKWKFTILIKKCTHHEMMTRSCPGILDWWRFAWPSHCGPKGYHVFEVFQSSLFASTELKILSLNYVCSLQRAKGKRMPMCSVARIRPAKWTTNVVSDARARNTQCRNVEQQRRRHTKRLRHVQIARTVFFNQSKSNEWNECSTRFAHGVINIIENEIPMHSSFIIFEWKSKREGKIDFALFRNKPHFHFVSTKFKFSDSFGVAVSCCICHRRRHRLRMRALCHTITNRNANTRARTANAKEKKKCLSSCSRRSPEWKRDVCAWRHEIVK